MANKSRPRGVGTSFTTNLGAIGDKASDSLFAPTQVNLLDEERRVIDKVFSIVDRDKSGTIDAKELEEMFHLFGCETSFLHQCIKKIMGNVDKDFDASISPEEFYKLLSQKFEKGDSRREIEDVFSKMDEKGDGNLDIDEVHKVSQMLGEQMTKDDIKEMMNCFKKLYKQTMMQDVVGPDGKKPKPLKANSMVSKFDAKDDIDPNLQMNMDEFYFIMQEDL